MLITYKLQGSSYGIKRRCSLNICFSYNVWCNAWTGSFKHRSAIFLHDAETQGKNLDNSEPRRFQTVILHQPRWNFHISHINYVTLYYPSYYMAHKVSLRLSLRCILSSFIECDRVLRTVKKIPMICFIVYSVRYVVRQVLIFW